MARRDSHMARGSGSFTVSVFIVQWYYHSAFMAIPRSACGKKRNTPWMKIKDRVQVLRQHIAPDEARHRRRARRLARALAISIRRFQRVRFPFSATPPSVVKFERLSCRRCHSWFWTSSPEETEHRPKIDANNAPFHEPRQDPCDWRTVTSPRGGKGTGRGGEGGLTISKETITQR